MRRPAFDAPVELTPLGRWQVQLQRLKDWRARIEAAPTMHGESWRAGQLRHIDALIAVHVENQPVAK